MRRRRHLSAEEKSLWAGVAGTAVPLPGRRTDAVVAADLVADATPGPRKGLEKSARSAGNVAVTKGTPPERDIVEIAVEVAKAARPARDAATPRHPMPSYTPPVARPSTPLFNPIERPVKRKIAKGRVAIEDRIDLHDKSQVVAHYALLGFLRRAQAEGMRHVLVITGRGASFGSSGVIRRSLPHWFHTAEFRGLVSGFDPADRVHGGEGAFYVRVRRR